jgi:hypothetical protein
MSEFDPRPIDRSYTVLFIDTVYVYCKSYSLVLRNSAKCNFGNTKKINPVTVYEFMGEISTKIKHSWLM